MTVGERIRKARKEKGLTQKALGEACGIAEPTIRRYELGKLNPKFETLQKIAYPLGVSASWLQGVEELPEEYIYKLLVADAEKMHDNTRKEEELAFLNGLLIRGGITEDDFENMYLLRSSAKIFLKMVGYTRPDADIPLPDGYDKKSYFVCKNARNGKIYIASWYEDAVLLHDLLEFAKNRLNEFFNSLPVYEGVVEEPKQSITPEEREEAKRIMEESLKNLPF